MSKMTARLLRYVLIIAAVADSAFPAMAEERTWSGKDLIHACQLVADGTPPTPDDALLTGVCLGEIEALNWIALGIHNERLRSCAPTMVTRSQLAKVVVAYLQQNAAQLREPFQSLALEALARIWPCQSE
ncbi:MAG: Rap1a/Tai family immunity protein [Xanthobacteraceae bacterium]|jgi:hypothetical protein